MGRVYFQISLGSGFQHLENYVLVSLPGELKQNYTNSCRNLTYKRWTKERNRGESAFVYESHRTALSYREQ
jgi:hypothetical protein